MRGRRLIAILALAAGLVLFGVAATARAQAPLLWYDFDDQADPTSNLGMLGSAYDGGLYGGASFVPFGGGSAVLLDGAADWVIPQGDVEALNIADDDFTLLATVVTDNAEPSVVPSYRFVIARETTGVNPTYALGVHRIIGEVYFGLADGTRWASTESTVAVNDGLPHDLAAVRSGDELFLFIDGQLDGCARVPPDFGSTASSNELIIGGRMVDSGSPTTGDNDDFNGVIDDIRMYDVAVVLPHAPPCCPGDLDGDFDADADVDLEDFAALVDCMAGPDQTPDPSAPECVRACLVAFDSDSDEDVDLADFAEFSIVLTSD